MFSEIYSTKYGRFLTGNDEISRTIIKKNQDGDVDYYWDDHIVSLYSKYVDENSTVIDVGANIGTHTIPLGKLCKKVYAFEPQTYLYYQLCANIFVNNLLNVTPFNYACYDDVTKLGLDAPIPDYLDNHNSASLGFVADKRDFNILAYPLDLFFRNENKEEERIDLIKIDAQGLDYKILLGSYNIFTRDGPTVFFEIEENQALSIKKMDYFNFFDTIGYTVEQISNADYIAIPK